MKRLPLVASFILFVALCASLTYWAMQFFKPNARPPAPPPQAPRQEVRIDAVAGLFGGKSAPVAVVSNFQLKGVVMSGTPAESVAILSADGKPPQTVRINKEVQPGVVVKEVHPSYVLLSEGGAIKRVELPEGAKNTSLSMGVQAPMAPGMPQGMVPGVQMPGAGEPQPLNVQPPQPAPQAGQGANPMAPAMPGSPPVMQQGGVIAGQPQHNGVVAVPPPSPGGANPQ